jgi:hypothetical protein
MSHPRYNFVHWAHRRIAQEISEIEMMEKEYGTAEWTVPKRGKKNYSNISKEQRKEVVTKIDKLRKDGYSYRIAAKTLNIDPSTYTKWRKELFPKKSIKLRVSRRKSK